MTEPTGPRNVGELTLEAFAALKYAKARTPQELADAYRWLDHLERTTAAEAGRAPRPVPKPPGAPRAE